MILEKCIVECDYKSMRNKSLLTRDNEVKSINSNLKDYVSVGMKNLADENNFKIIDIDNFMKGNPLVTDKLDFDWFIERFVTEHSNIGNPL